MSIIVFLAQTQTSQPVNGFGWPKSWQDLANIASPVAVIIAAWAVILTQRQIRANEKSGKQQRDDIAIQQKQIERQLELQENAARPYVQVFFDRKSRVGLVLLRAMNHGAGVAYDVHLDWDKHPQDAIGAEVTGLDSMDLLLPGGSEKVEVGGTIQFFKKHVDSNYQGVTYQGVAHYKDATGRCLSNRLTCPVHAPKGSILDDDEMDKTVRSVQNIPDKLTEIAEAIKRLENT